MKTKALFLKNKIYNYMMVDGKKTMSEKKILKSSKILQKNTIKNHKNIIKLAIMNAAPTIQMKQIKKRNEKRLRNFHLS